MTALGDSYCGPAIGPADLPAAWNLDPVLLIGLLSGLLLLWRHDPLWSSIAFALLLAAFVSPLCSLSVSLFSARSVHHVILIALAAPCLALGLRVSRPFLPALPASLLHLLVLWGWHIPSAYSAALSNDLIYWVMELSLLGSAVALWHAALRSAGRLDAAMALLGTMMQMGLLGALLTFAGRPLYEPHLFTTLPYGLSPLSDQQLAGLIMWVPGSLPYLAAGVLCLLPVIRGGTARAA